MNNHKKMVAVIYNNKGCEKEISFKTAQAVTDALKKLSYSYFLVKADFHLVPNLLENKPDLAFLAGHGIYGEDGCVQGVCEHLSIPYTGSGLLASALCMDKIFLKNFLLKHLIATPDFQIVDKNWKPDFIDQYPVVVKASHGGSTLGTYIVKNSKSLMSSIKKAQDIGRFVFIENYLSSGKEIAVSYLDGQILTPVEIIPKGGFYDYKRKYEKDQSEYYVPPRLDDFTLAKIKSISQKVFSLIGVRNYARSDFIVDNKNRIWLLEVNTLPGLTTNSLLPKSAAYDGINFDQLIQKIIDGATSDYNF